jgi:guanine deaminase
MILAGRLLIDPAETPAPGWVAVTGDRIDAVGHGPPPAAPDVGDAESATTVICPGFFDAHMHVPQVDSIGCDGRRLLEWLDTVIFPAEMRWSDPAFARRQAVAACRRMLETGTLGYGAFLTAHTHALDALRAAHEEIPLRGLAGQARMDRGGPAPLLGHADAPLAPDDAATRLRCSVNPRFAISCSDEQLAAAGRAAGGTAFVQTHLAEQTEECRRVAELFPDAPHYAGVYDAAGLLTERTLLAHCVHLSEAEWRLVAERGSVVVHCPGANTFLESGLFDLDAARRHGVRLALGSDVAAGPDLAMPRVARAMIEVAKLRRLAAAPDAPVPTPAEAWHLITAGNADALGLPDGGRLAVGAAADLLVLDTPLPIDDAFVGRLLYTWRTDYISHRILAGKLLD